jgi:hypothetical protein
MARHGDPHIREGALAAIPVERNLRQGRAVNNWNNRGRHGVQ